MSKYGDIKKLYEDNADAENAVGMKKYMRDQFDYYGISSSERKLLTRDFLKEERKAGIVDWDFLDSCWQDEHREFQYLACAYLERMVKFLAYDDLPKIKTYVQDKSWWDTIDSLCKIVGAIGEADSRTDEVMLEWAQDEDLWVRRTAIEHQLGRKERTNTETLEKILVMNFGTKEFFINKAIGWALRDYSKTNPGWAADFIARHREEMHSLSIREGSKYI